MAKDKRTTKAATQKRNRTRKENQQCHDYLSGMSKQQLQAFYRRFDRPELEAMVEQIEKADAELAQEEAADISREIEALKARQAALQEVTA